MGVTIKAFNIHVYQLTAPSQIKRTVDNDPTKKRSEIIKRGLMKGDGIAEVLGSTTKSRRLNRNSLKRVVERKRQKFVPKAPQSKEFEVSF